MRKDVSVVRLRHEGVKLAPEVVKLSALVRGQLSLSRALSGGEVANFYDPVKSTALFPRMIEARITKERADGSFVVVGMEEVERGRQVLRFPQAWGCRPLPVARQPSIFGGLSPEYDDEDLGAAG